LVPILGSDNLPGCSGVIVSNSGYMVTDFHCLMNKTRSSDGEISDLSPTVEFRKGRVIAQGQGTYLKFPKSSDPGFNYQEFNKNFDDWALVKLPERPDGYACSQASENSPEGSSVYHLGFPEEYTMQNSWLRAMLDPGQHEFKNPGLQQLRQKLAEEFKAALQKGEPWAVSVAFPLYISLGYNYGTVKAAAKRLPLMNQQADLDKVIDSTRFNYSTAPIHIGMSGGGVFGIDTGHLIGLNVFTFGNLQFSYVGFPYGIGFIKIPYVKEAIRRKVGDKIVSQAFDCKPTTKNVTHFLASE
jgi:hypothetical protein